ncbi:MAG: hypothetical protein ACKOA9_09915 [Actinomycetota bacterium]
MTARRIRLGITAAATIGALVAGCGAPDPRGDSSSRGGRVARYCEIQARFGDLDLLSDTDPDAVRADLRALLALTRDAARVAPRDVRVDAEAAVVAQVRFNGFYAANGWDPDATNRDRGFIAFANSPELGALYTRLEDYQSRVCGPDRGPFDDQLA